MRARWSPPGGPAPLVARPESDQRPAALKEPVHGYDKRMLTLLLIVLLVVLLVGGGVGGPRYYRRRRVVERPTVVEREYPL